MIWRKLADSFPLSVGTTKFWPSKKYRVKRNGEDWQLIIKNVQHTDAGEYECRLSGQDDIADVLALIIPGLWERRWRLGVGGTFRAKLQVLVYDILPSTTAVFSYAIGSRV